MPANVSWSFPGCIAITRAKALPGALKDSTNILEDLFMQDEDLRDGMMNMTYFAFRDRRCGG